MSNGNRKKHVLAIMAELGVGWSEARRIGQERAVIKSAGPERVVRPFDEEGLRGTIAQDAFIVSYCDATHVSLPRLPNTAHHDKHGPFKYR